MIFNESKYNGNWSTKTLNDLGEFKRGKSRHRPRNDKALFTNGTYPLIQTGDVKAANLYISNHSKSYNNFGLQQSRLWDKGTLCITIAANIAETALLGYPMCFPDSIVGFTADPNESSEIFMHYVFTYIKKSIQNSVIGSIQDNINIGYLTSLKFKIPNKSYQQKIVSILSSIDKKMELNIAINHRLEAIANLTYTYWFVQFEFPDSKGKPYKSNGGEMVWSKDLKQEIPKGWKVDKLNSWINDTKSGDWGEEQSIGNYTKKVVCIRGADLNSLNGNNNNICTPPIRYIHTNNTHKVLTSHDIIIEISGGSPTQSTGRLSYLTEQALNRFNNPVICSNFCKALTLKNPKHLYNFAFLWNRLYDHDVLFGYEGKTSGIKNLLFDSFVDSYKTIIPKNSIMEKFYDFMQDIEARKQINLLENQKLAKLRDWLLPMLMNGQVTVK